MSPGVIDSNDVYMLYIHSGIVMLLQSPNLNFINVRIFPNTYSVGLKSGEYAGI